MPASRTTQWLICYDIADPRRLQRVHRTVCRHAIPYQYSVFAMLATRKQVTEAILEVAQHIDDREDDLRAYPLLTSAPGFSYGQAALPDGIVIAE